MTLQFGTGDKWLSGVHTVLWRGILHWNNVGGNYFTAWDPLCNWSLCSPLCLSVLKKNPHSSSHASVWHYWHSTAPRLLQPAFTCFSPSPPGLTTQSHFSDSQTYLTLLSGYILRSVSVPSRSQSDDTILDQSSCWSPQHHFAPFFSINPYNLPGCQAVFFGSKLKTSLHIVTSALISVCTRLESGGHSESEQPQRDKNDNRDAKQPQWDRKQPQKTWNETQKHQKLIPNNNKDTKWRQRCRMTHKQRDTKSSQRNLNTSVAKPPQTDVKWQQRLTMTKKSKRTKAQNDNRGAEQPQKNNRDTKKSQKQIWDSNKDTNLQRCRTTIKRQ